MPLASLSDKICIQPSTPDSGIPTFIGEHPIAITATPTNIRTNFISRLLTPGIVAPVETVAFVR